MQHYPVLLNEAIDLLNIKPNGFYIDGTFGRGGHSTVILHKLLNTGKLVAFDKDPLAINYANTHEIFNSAKNFNIIHDSFAKMYDYLLSELSGVSDNTNCGIIDGILLDLGVSSPQLDDSNQGFSFRFDSILDMRMNNQSGQTAFEWLNTVNESDLSEVLWAYGEEINARKIAKNIIKYRVHNTIATTTQLVEIILSTVLKNYDPKNNTQLHFKKHPATKTFQAIRIFINRELDDLKEFFTQLSLHKSLFKKDARIVIISFHSLEDRIVKEHFKKITQKTPLDDLPKWAIVSTKDHSIVSSTIHNEVNDFSLLIKKIRPNIKELNENHRSRSAVMRAIIKN